MIVSRLKLEFAGTEWMNASEGSRRVFACAGEEMRAMKDRAVESMSLNELLYYVLVGDGVAA